MYIFGRNSCIAPDLEHSLTARCLQVMRQSQQVVGKASVGGAFELVDYNGKPFTDK
jgi:hypothetical protein